MTPNPWNSPATVSAIVAALSAAVAIWQAARAVKSSKSAKVSEEIARKQADEANNSRRAASEALNAMQRVSEEQLALDKQRLAVSYRVTCRNFAQRGDASHHAGIVFTIYNSSVERTLTVTEIGVATLQSHEPPAIGSSGLPVVSEERLSDKDRSIAVGEQREILITAIGTTDRYGFGILSAANAVYVRFAHTDEPYILAGTPALTFLDICRALADWREAHQQTASDPGSRALKKFRPYGPEFYRSM